MSIGDNRHVQRFRGGFWRVVMYVVGMFYNLKRRELRQRQKQAREKERAEQLKAKMLASNVSTCQTFSNTNTTTSTEPNGKWDPPKGLKPINGAITPDAVTKIRYTDYLKKFLYREDIPNAGPYADKSKMKVGVKQMGILIKGYRCFPQFLPVDKIRANEKKEPDYDKYEIGFLMKTGENQVFFYPECYAEFDTKGFPIFKKEMPSDFEQKGLEIWNDWLIEKERIETEKKLEAHNKMLKLENEFNNTIVKLREENTAYEKKSSEMKSTIKELHEDLDEFKAAKEDERVFRNRFVLILLIIIAICILLLLYGVFCQKCSNDSLIAPACGSHSTSITGHNTNGNSSAGLGGTGTGIGSQGNGETTLTTTPSLATTTTKAYPNLVESTDRVASVVLIKPTFEIASSSLQIHLNEDGDPTTLTTIVIKQALNVTSRTDKIHLHSELLSTRALKLEHDGNPYRFDFKAQNDLKGKQLTITLSQPVENGSLTLLLNNSPDEEILDRYSFPCGSQICSVRVLQRLRLLTFHYENTLKHKWSIKVENKPNITVLTNGATINTQSRFTTYQDTVPLLPSEVSLVILMNYVTKVPGNRVDSVMPEGTKVEEVKGLVDLLETTLQSMKQTSTLSKEKFSIVVVPPMENYEFNGRNVALVGTSFLRSNKETKMEFVWRWIYRSVIYDKVTSSDGHPTWVYEQSAFFLSTVIKSSNTKLWKKHLYELAMEGGLSDMQPPVNPSTTYEDEQRYLDKPQHFAKVSTVLGMLTGLGVAVSGNPLTNLDANRDQSTSGRFFFLKSTLKLENEEAIAVDKVASCYIDSPDVPFVLIIRTDPTTVEIQRPNGGSNHRCDTHLWFLRDTSKTMREHKLLSDKAENVQIQTNSAILLSGDSPLSAYGYSMDQQEFDKLLDSNVLVSFDASSVNLLAFNAFQAAAEGTLTYESLQSFMKVVLPQKIVSVDEAVDLWMGTVIHSRNDNLASLTESIVVSVLKDAGDTTTMMTDYIDTRLTKFVKEAPLFEIEKVKKLFKYCGSKCFNLVGPKYFAAEKCVTGANPGCTYDPHLLEVYVCSRVVTDSEHDKYNKLYGKCKGKPCRLPVLRGLLCTNDEANLKSWLDKTTNLSAHDMGDRQEIQTIFQGLASNVISKPWLLNYLLDNWYLLHKKHFEFPVLLGDVVDSLAATVSTREQLDQLKQFVAFYGDKLSGYKEFKYQASKAEKALEWNSKYSQKFSVLFN